MGAWAEAAYVIEEVKNALDEGEDRQIYGFIEHMDILDPTERIEYIGINKGYSAISITMGGGFSLGDWADFPLLANNKPYMVTSEGIADYELSSSNYALKADGTGSDVTNTSYDGGAFSWLQKIYKKEYVVGSDRYVKFSLEPRDGYFPTGFVDDLGAELEGVWIPMFYGSIVNSKVTCVSGTTPMASNTTATEKTAIDAVGARARFFGGPIINTITDLLLMWGKNCDLQDKYGYGNCSGGSSGVLDNAVVSGGQFYGTATQTDLNKILHSVVLGSYQQWMRDPYTILYNGHLYVSNYSYDISTPQNTYIDTGVEYETTGGWHYPDRFGVVEDWGAVPAPPYKGSTTLGACDGFYKKVGILAVALRFGGANLGLIGGLRALDLSVAATTATWRVGAALFLLPPAGHTPYDTES